MFALNAPFSHLQDAQCPNLSGLFAGWFV